jgi:hypothetical protein
MYTVPFWLMVAGSKDGLERTRVLFPWTPDKATEDPTTAARFLVKLVLVTVASVGPSKNIAPPCLQRANLLVWW